MTGIIILAAGASTRLGEPKQKLLYKGKSLLQHTIQTAIDSNCKPVVVVTGYDHRLIEKDIDTREINFVHNAAWESGMASSINKGLVKMLQLQPTMDSIIFLLCDQPFVDVPLINSLIDQHNTTPKKIIACAYNDTLGAPVLFDREYFNELLSLTGQEGAKKLILKHAEDVASVPFPAGAIDIDTPADYAALTGKGS